MWCGHSPWKNPGCATDIYMYIIKLVLNIIIKCFLKFKPEIVIIGVGTVS